MNEDFLDAHKRHWDDAEQLFASQRLANADHLYGISAECGLKKLIEIFKQGPLGGGDRLHIMEAKKPSNAWDRFESYRSGHVLGPKFPTSPNPFTQWDVSQRYAHQCHFNQTRVQPHRHGADQVRQLLRTAALEGLL